MLDLSAEKKDNGSVSYSRLGAMCLLIFLTAIGVRLFLWQDNQQNFPYAGMTGEYKAHARVLVKGDLVHFLQGPDPASDANVAKHPPGYPLLIAAIYKIFGNSDNALRWAHIILDAVAALLVFFIAIEMFPLGVGFVAGLLVAFSPQLAYHSIALLPDPLATPPLLLAILFLVRTIKRPRLWSVIAAGVFVGVSCWFRSNAMLLPLLLAALSPFLFARGMRLRFSVGLVAAALLTIAPITIRNAFAFGRFIPLSVSAGITLIEGIGVYDTEHKLDLPSTDYGVTKWEAEEFKRPDYIGTRFRPDGFEREQHRLRRGLAVVRDHPFWFFRVMLHRGTAMLRLTRVDIVSANPGVTQPLGLMGELKPVRVISPAELIGQGTTADAQTKLSLSADEEALLIETDDPNDIFLSSPLNVEKNTDYRLSFPMRIKQGALIAAVVDAQREITLASTPILHPQHLLNLMPEDDGGFTVQRPFVNHDATQVRLVLENGKSSTLRAVAEIGPIELFALGPASSAWTQYPRLIVRGVQKVFLTAFMLPFMFIGTGVLVHRRRWNWLAVLLSLPFYYMCVQSVLWSEFRYILPMHYLLLLLAALGLYWTGGKIWLSVRRVLVHSRKE